MRGIARLVVRCSNCHHEGWLDGKMLEEHLGQPLTFNAAPRLFRWLYCRKCGARNLCIFDDTGRLLIDSRRIVSCRQCGLPVPLPRLEAMPGTQICALCAADFETRSDAPEWPRPPRDAQTCPRCRRPTVVYRNSKTGELFLGCTGYPKCHWSAAIPG